MPFPLSSQQLQEEQKQFDQEVQKVKQWFKSDRFKLTTRPYTAEDGSFNF